jgi:hypothetical protein
MPGLPASARQRCTARRSLRVPRARARAVVPGPAELRTSTAVTRAPAQNPHGRGAPAQNPHATPAPHGVPGGCAIPLGSPGGCRGRAAAQEDKYPSFLSPPALPLSPPARQKSGSTPIPMVALGRSANVIGFPGPNNGPAQLPVQNGCVCCEIHAAKRDFRCGPLRGRLRASPTWIPTWTLFSPPVLKSSPLKIPAHVTAWGTHPPAGPARTIIFHRRLRKIIVLAEPAGGWVAQAVT